MSCQIILCVCVISFFHVYEEHLTGGHCFRQQYVVSEADLCASVQRVKLAYDRAPQKSFLTAASLSEFHLPQLLTFDSVPVPLW